MAQASMFDDATTAPLPDGVVVHDGWLDVDEEQALLDEVEAQHWVKSPTGRSHQRYGCFRDSEGQITSQINTPTVERSPGLEVIGALGLLSIRMQEEGIVARTPGITVFDYPAGSGFEAGPDPDARGTVATVSLCTSVEMQFADSDGSVVPFLAERRSLLIVPYHVRRRWSLAMIARDTDPAFAVVRRRRVTISLRD